MQDITKAHFRWRTRIGLPFPAIFGHTTIEIEKYDGRCHERKTYGFVGWGDSWLENIFLFFRIISGFSVDGNWHDNAENLLGIAQPWRNISEEEYLALKRKLDLLMSFAVKYNLYTRNSWQVPKRLLKTWMNGG